MAILKKLFGGVAGPSSKASPSGASSAPAGADTVKFLDAYGRWLQVPRESWRTQILLPNLASKREDANALHDLIVGALRDGFAADVEEPARHLAAIDPQRGRSANLLGVVLLQLKRYSDARTILEQALGEVGEEGYMTTNLAKAYGALGDTAKRDELLWRALERDPNQDNGLLWFAALAKDRDGAEGQAEALARVAALPGSWRAQVWIARQALASGDVQRAEALYREALSRVEPVPADALMQISGDLGNKGQVALALELCAPRFDPALHGIQVGNNLIKANLDLGRTDEARRILEQLYARQRRDWSEVLTDWERRIDEAEKRYGPVEGPIPLELMALDQPLWAAGRLGFEALLPAKEADAPRVTFVCGTSVRDPKQTQARVERTDALGQVTRTIPLYLADELCLGTSARARVLVPVAHKSNLALIGTPWSLEDLARAGVQADLVVTLHVDVREGAWQLKFSAYTWATRALLSSWVVPMTVAQPLPAIHNALEQLLRELKGVAGMRLLPESSVEQWGMKEHAAQYAVCLESALILALAAGSEAERPGIWGERGLIDTLLHFAVALPRSARSRLLLLNSLEKEARRRPDIVRQYAEKLSLLQKQYPLPPGLAADLAAAAAEMIRRAVSVQ